MARFDKNRTSEYEDISRVFAKRDQARADQRQPEPREAPEASEPLQDSQRIRGVDQYSVESMRQVHEGQVVYHQRTSSAPAKKRRRKKRGFFRTLLRLLGLLLLLALVFGLGSVILARMPQSDRPIGPRRDGCATVLLCGTDEDGTRTDTMVLLFIDRNARQLRLLSLPRDTMVNRDNPVPKLNGAYGANGLGEKGMDVLMDYVRDLIGYRPDGYMLIDLECFARLVDAMGGVTFDVPVDMYYNDPTQDLYIDLKAGTQTLSGQESMWVVRYRSGYAMADLERVKVQRAFLSAAMHQWMSLKRLPRLPYAMGLLMKNTQTDLGYRELCWLGLSAIKCGTGGLESDTLPGSPQTVNGGSYYVEDRQAAAELVNEKYNPYEKEIQPNDLHPYGY